MESTYKIIANGTDMGTYEAATEAEALEAYARDAGYETWEAACEVASGEGVKAVEVDA